MKCEQTHKTHGSGISFINNWNPRLIRFWTNSILPLQCESSVHARENDRVRPGQGYTWFCGRKFFTTCIGNGAHLAEWPRLSESGPGPGLSHSCSITPRLHDLNCHGHKMILLFPNHRASLAWRRATFNEVKTNLSKKNFSLLHPNPNHHRRSPSTHSHQSTHPQGASSVCNNSHTYNYIELHSQQVLTASQFAAHSVRILSWNVQEIIDPVKCPGVFNSRYYVLQETHLKIPDQKRLHKPWISQVLHSKFNTRARGTQYSACHSVFIQQHVR